MAQLMPLPLTVSCFSKIQIGFTFSHASTPFLQAGCSSCRPTKSVKALNASKLDTVKT